MKIVIENNVPIPDKLVVRQSKYKPLTKMKVNQSAFIECNKIDHKKEITKCRSLLDSYGRKQTPSYKYTFRTVEGGFRVWRVK